MSDSFATPWTIARQAPLSMGFPRQEYWSGLPFPSLGGLPDTGIEPPSPTLAEGLFTTEQPGKPYFMNFNNINSVCGSSQVVLVIKNPPTNAGDARDEGLIPGSGRSSEVGNGIPLSTLAWKITWAEEPGRLKSMGLQRVRQLKEHTHTHTDTHTQ